MAKKKSDPKLEAWVAARKRHRLSHAQVQMARELGLNPAKLGKIDNHRQEPWKAPLPEFIESLYEKRFGRPRPENVLSLEDLARERARKEQARREARAQRRLARSSETAMDDKSRTAASKFLSYVLRHEPAAVGIALDSGGWVDVDVLLEAFAQHGRRLSRAELDEVVATNPKQRFALSDDGQRIRANQGHSTAVDLGYEPAEPPDVLFHGTVPRLLPSIRDNGLLRMERHHVHLSPDEATARIVGGRRGRPVILRINARAMRETGHVFFVTPNGVWLTDAVPSSFISGWGDEQR